MNILVTAFEPFGGEKLNPTEIILKKLPDTVCGYEIRKVLLPVEFIRAREIAFAAYDQCAPAAVIMLGQAGGRSAITPETTGKNVMYGRIPDNAGYVPDHLSVVENGPDELYSGFSADDIVTAVKALGIPCEASDDAGMYVCNTLLYGMLAHNHGEVPTGFIHVPYLREQGHEDQPSMELEDMCRGIAEAVRTVAETLEREKEASAPIRQ